MRFITVADEESYGANSKSSAVPSFKSKFVGVTWQSVNKKWKAGILIDRKHHYLGLFDSEEGAARAFDEHAASLGRPINFPGPGQALAVKRGAHGIVSQYTGVSWNMGMQKWEANTNIDGKNNQLGYHSNEKAAARAYDECAGPLGRPVNFPLEKGQAHAGKRGASKYEGVKWNFGKQLWEAVGIKHGERLPLGCFKTEEEAARAVDDHFLNLGLTRRHFPEKGELRQASVKKSSKFVGVFRLFRSGRWFAQVGINGEDIRLGYFDSEEEAARAYDLRAAALGKPINFPTDGQEQAVKRGSSKLHGVTKRGKKWATQISIDGKSKHLGTFDSEEAAARKFDDAAAPLGRAVNFPFSIGKTTPNPAAPLS
jgi:hypothetical protein